MGEYSNEGILFSDFEKLSEFWVEHTEKFKIIYQPRYPREEFDLIADMVYNVGDCVFVVEELDTFCSPYEISPSFSDVIRRGRHNNIDFIGITQRPHGINRTLTSQANEIISFHQSEPRDIDFLSLYIGQEAKKLNSLSQYEYLYYNNGKIETFK